MKLKIKRVAIKDKIGNIVIFKLSWSYNDAEFQKYIEQNTYELGKYSHMIVPENTIPVLYLNMNELMKISYENVRRLELMARDT